MLFCSCSVRTLWVTGFLIMHQFFFKFLYTNFYSNPAQHTAMGNVLSNYSIILFFCSRSRPGGRSENLGVKNKLKAFWGKMLCLLPPPLPRFPRPRDLVTVWVWSLTVAVIQCLNYSLIFKTAVCTYKLWQSNWVLLVWNFQMSTFRWLETFVLQSRL